MTAISTVVLGDYWVTFCCLFCPFFFQESRFLIGLHYRRLLKSFLHKEVRLYISELSFEESSLVILGGIISPLLQINKTVKGA